MYTLKIENAAGEIFELTHNRSNYSLTKVTGLTPPAANINTSAAGTIDGTFFNSARVNQRNIVLYITLEGDIEANRQNLYRIFPIKSPCTVYFRNEHFDVKIDGYVEIVDGDLFSMREQMQISIICPRSYWTALAQVAYELSTVVKMFSFPFSIAERPGVPMSEYTVSPVISIINGGSVPCGFTATIEFTGTVSGFKLVNATTQKYFGFLPSLQFQAGDVLEISTVSGELYARVTRSGAIVSVMNSLDGDSEWLKLALGENRLSYTISGDMDDVDISIDPALLYAGV